ncbi:MAG: hypothetical protein WAX77_15130 [Methylococcaceae bacterium]
MQITFTLNDDIALQLQALPNIDEFVNQAIKNALQYQNPTPTPPSKWALFAQEIKNNPQLQLGDYAQQFKNDLIEFKEDFSFASDNL